MHSIDNIKNIFESHKAKNIQELKKVVVLIALIDIDGISHVIFQKRSSFVNQSGDISFIGGHIEKDETAYEAVIRETCEECNVTKENIIIFGESDYLLNYSGLFMHVFVGQIIGINFKDIKANEEVEKLYAIPLEKILSCPFTVYNIHLSIDRPDYFPYELITNGERYNFFKVPSLTFFYEFEECVVWGLTANILHSFINIIKEYKHNKRI